MGTRAVQHFQTFRAMRKGLASAALPFSPSATPTNLRNLRSLSLRAASIAAAATPPRVLVSSGPPSSPPPSRSVVSTVTAPLSASSDFLGIPRLSTIETRGRETRHAP